MIESCLKNNKNGNSKNRKVSTVKLARMSKKGVFCEPFCTPQWTRLQFNLMWLEDCEGIWSILNCDALKVWKLEVCNYSYGDVMNVFLQSLESDTKSYLQSFNQKVTKKHRKFASFSVSFMIAFMFFFKSKISNFFATNCKKIY